jgi:hypothetical protein
MDTCEKPSRPRHDGVDLVRRCESYSGDFPAICTAAFITATSCTPFGTRSMRIRMGTRCARRTQVKIGLTVKTPHAFGRELDPSIARAMLSTRPRMISMEPVS